MKKPIFKSILVSYLLIGTLIILLNAISYGNYFTELKANTNATAEYKVSHITDHLNSHVQSTQKYMDALSVSDNLQSYVSTLHSPESALIEKRLKDELMQASILDSCNKLMVFSLREDSVFVTPGRNYNQEMLPIFSQQYGIPYDDVLQIINFDGLYGYQVFPDGKVWIMKAVLNDKPERIAVIATEVEIDFLFEDQIEQSNEELIVLNKEGTAIYNSGHVSDIDYLSKTSFSANGEKYSYVASEEQVFGCTIEIGIPFRELNRGYVSFALIVGLELLISIVIIACAAFFLAQRTYTPVEKVMHVLDSSEGQGNYDWDALLQNTKEMVAQNRSLVKSEKSSKEVVQGKRVVRILRGLTKDTESIRSIMTDWIGLSDNSPYIMALVHFENNKDSSLVKVNSQTGQERDYELEYFALKNVLDELVFEETGGGIVSIDFQYVLFIKAPSEECVSGIAEVLQKVIDSFDKYLGTHVEIIVSSIRCGYEYIGSTYNELKREAEYCHFWGNTSETNTVQYAVDLTADSQTINYAEYLDSNRRLMNYLELEDYNKAYETLENMYKNVFSKDKRYFMYNKYRMYGVIALLTLSLDIKRDKSDLAFFQHLNYEEKLFQVTSMEQLMEVSKELFESIIAYEERRDEEERQPAWVDDVIGYIERHYMDDSLSVTMIADEFDFSVSYFSRTFKSYMGCGVLELIHKVRIQKAKELLQSGKSIKDTARAVGYLDSKALTRSFKKYEGITAEQYTKIASEQTENHL